MAKRTPEETRQLIREALIDLFVESQRNMDSVSVSGVCKRAGIARSTFYTYYADPYGVMQEIQDLLIQGLNDIDDRSDRIQTDRRDHTYSTFGAVDTLRFLDKHRHEFVALMCDGGEPLFVHKVKAHIDERLSEMTEVMGGASQPDILAAFVGGAMFDANCYWLKERPDLSPEEASSEILALVDACMPARERTRR